MKAQDVKNCMFSSWYNVFQSYTIKSKIVKIPSHFMKYLHADGIVLPEGETKSEVRKQPYESENTSSDSDTDWDTTEPESADIPEFGEFGELITKAIKNLGGAVFPKLNWSSPKDAVWITADSSLRCTSVSDICLLLKSSDFIAHDLTQPFDRCEDVTCERDVPIIEYTLVLRKWKQLHPAGEFRCFVKNKQLIGICQRHASSHYPFLQKDEESIVEDIQLLFDSVVRGKFNSQSYVFDVYRREKGSLLLMDFNPFGPLTDGLLFTWDELLDMRVEPNVSVKPVFRCIQTEAGVQPNPYSCYTMPVDFLHLSKGEDPYKLHDFLHLKIQSQRSEESSSEDGEEAKAIPEEQTPPPVKIESDAKIDVSQKVENLPHDER